METNMCLTLMCVVLSMFLVAGTPSVGERRFSRDLDKIDELRSRLHQLQKQIRDMGPEEQPRHPSMRQPGNDVSRLGGGTEAQMTSQRQKQELAEVLSQLLQESAEEQGPEGSNTAGEYLSDKYNNHRGPHHNDDKRAGKGKEEEEEEEELEQEEEEEGRRGRERKRLENIYSMLQRLYSQQERGHTSKEGGLGKASHLNTVQMPRGREASSLEMPDFQEEEGTFGEFMDSEEETQASASVQEKRKAAVLLAVENRLLDDLQEARDAGFSVDDLIQDVQNKVDTARGQKLREIEEELDRLSGKQ